MKAIFDYFKDLIRTPSRREMLFARSAIVTAAVANELQSIDLVCLEYTNDATLETECKEGRELGFTGKQAIHPRQLDIIHQSFSPRPQEIEYAMKIVQGYEAHAKQGFGAFGLDGKVVDMPVVKWAQRCLAKANKLKQEK